jgi:CheY-like chemotaxis protein
MRVYIADDLPDIRHAARRILIDAGHHVRTFESADDALDAIRAQAPDLLLSDVCMPGQLDGVELAELLSVELPSLPVIIMSSEQTMLDRARSIPTIRRLILKPVTRAEVLAGVAAATAPGVGGPTAAASGGAAADIARVLDQATEIAARTSHPHVGPEHLALMALDGPDGFKAVASRAGVDPSKLAKVLANCCPDTDDVGNAEATDSTISVLARAAQLARLEGSQRIRSGHLVVALLQEPNAILWIGLTALGLRPQRVAAYVGGSLRLMLEPSLDELPTVTPPRRIH